MNPEFKRHLWLELSWHRLVAMPCVLALIFLLAMLSADTDVYDRVASTGLVLCLVLAAGWGTQRVSSAVLEEWHAKTWDSQRMSALGPWEMTWGKLLGSTVFAWYGALLCLGVVIVAWPRDWPYTSMSVMVCVVCTAVGVQALGLITSLMAARKGLLRTRWRGLMTVPLLLLVSGVISRAWSLFSQGLVWWSVEYVALHFVLGSAVVWAAWSVFGAYRLMCQELQVRTTPWAWVVFVLFLAWYLGGFVNRPQASASLWLVGMVVAGGLTYLMLFTEQTGALVVRRIWVRVQRREWQRALEELPCWLISLVLAALCSVLLLGRMTGQSMNGLEEARELGVFPSLLLLFLVRDVAIFLGFAFAQAPRRVEATTLFYLALFYLIVPGVCALAGVQILGALILPPVFTQPEFASVVLVGHALLALSWMTYRWRQSFQAASL